MHQHWETRINMCIQKNGSHAEHIMSIKICQIYTNVYFSYVWKLMAHPVLCFIGRVNQAPCIGLLCNHTHNTLGTVL